MAFHSYLLAIIRRVKSLTLTTLSRNLKPTFLILIFRQWNSARTRSSPNGRRRWWPKRFHWRGRYANCSNLSYDEERSERISLSYWKGVLKYRNCRSPTMTLQKAFVALRRTIADCRWNAKDIVVLGTVRITDPYGEGNATIIQPTVWRDDIYRN